MMEGREARLVLGVVEVTAAAQMDEEVNSVSGRHGNLPDKDHRWVVRREFRNDNNLLFLKSFLSFTICDCLEPDHAKYLKTFFTRKFSSPHAEK